MEAMDAVTTTEMAEVDPWAFPANLTASEDKLEWLRAKSEEAATVSAKSSDQFFLIVISIVIFFMQCGFAFLEAGSVRSDNYFRWM